MFYIIDKIDKLNSLMKTNTTSTGAIFGASLGKRFFSKVLEPSF